MSAQFTAIKIGFAQVDWLANVFKIGLGDDAAKVGFANHDGAMTDKGDYGAGGVAGVFVGEPPDETTRQAGVGKGKKATTRITGGFAAVVTKVPRVTSDGPAGDAATRAEVIGEISHRYESV